MNKILIAGAGGLANELVSWIGEQFEVIGYTTSSDTSVKEFGLPGKGFTDDEVTPELAGTNLVYVAIGSPKTRRKLYFLYKEKGFQFPTYVHPSSVVADSVTLGEGVIVAPHCVISPNVGISLMTYINFQSGIGHDSHIGEFVQVNPGCQLGGFTRVGNGTLLGSGSVILQGVEIGGESTVASGSVVFSKVVDGATVMGNPAKRMRAFER